MEDTYCFGIRSEQVTLPMEDTYCFGIRSEQVALPNGGYLLFRHTVRTSGFAQWRIPIVSAYGQNKWLCPMEDTYCFGIRSEQVALPNGGYLLFRHTVRTSGFAQWR